MLELIRKNTFLTNEMAIEINSNVDRTLTDVSINTVDSNVADGFTEKASNTLNDQNIVVKKLPPVEMIIIKSIGEAEAN